MAEGSTGELSSLIAVRPLDPREWEPAAWDGFAAACGASMRSAHAHLQSLQLRLAHKGRVTTYGLYLPAGPRGELIGWFTVVAGLRVTRFYDGLRLRPDHAPLWPSAMRAALQFLGDGRYEYGWALSLEPCRAAELSSLPEVTRLQDTQVVVHAVDFSRWTDWNAYLRDVSENSRRNARKAQKLHPALKVEEHRGVDSLRAAPAMMRLRSDMYQRKGLAFRGLRSLAGYLAGAVLCPEQAMMATATAGSQTLAAYRGVEFGPLTYYMDGAGATEANGASWFLLLEMAQRAFNRTPGGKFILGFVRYPLARAIPEGLIRSRQALRASEFRTSTLSFVVKRPPQPDPWTPAWG